MVNFYCNCFNLHVIFGAKLSESVLPPGLFLFLEEGQLVAPDSVHVLRLMLELAALQCPDCNSFHLHNPRSSKLYKVESNKVKQLTGY
jgi:hypothetical protein